MSISAGMVLDVFNSPQDVSWDWWRSGQQGVGSINMITIFVSSVFQGYMFAFGRDVGVFTIDDPGIFASQFTLLFSLDGVIEFVGIFEAVMVDLSIIAEDIGIFVGNYNGQDAG